MRISCERASHICNKSQYREATFWEILKLRLHILTCKTCAMYTKRNTSLTSLCERAGLMALSRDDKKTMKKNLEKHF